MKRPPKKKNLSAPVDPLYARLLSFEPRRRDLRKALIVESAITCIAKEGIENTHFESIGKRSQMGRAHVKYYFKSRDEIVSAAIEFVATTAQMITLECISRAQSPQERLLAFVEGAFLWAEKYPDHLCVMGLNYYYCTVDKKYRKVHTEIRRLGEERVTAILRDYAPKLSAAAAHDLGKVMQNLILGNIVDWGTTTSAITLASLRKTTENAVLSLVEAAK